MKMRYNGPAAGWTEGLPIGNGAIGAVIAGGGDAETWYVTESTFWSGKPERTPSRSNGKADLARVRERFFAGDYEGGEKLVEELLMPEKGNFGTNVAMCDVQFRYGHSEARFVRELDLETAIVRIAYEFNRIRFERETFASHADGIVASRIRSHTPGRVTFSLEISGRTDDLEAVQSGDSDRLLFRCQATESVHSDGRCGVRGAGAAKVILSGGTVRHERDKLMIEGADEAVVIFAASTDYGTRDEDWKHEPEHRVELAAAKGFDRLRQDHVADYRALYARVTIKLGGDEAGMEAAEAEEMLPTDERTTALREGRADDPGLFALFYQYGRYLMISGSREDSKLPMHLQGIWNDGEASRMAWSCDYHLDVNTQMNYYPAETGNLAECHLPLLHFTERLSEAGKDAARDFYGCEGWVAHVFTNAWGFTAPGWHYSWGMNVTGGLWLAAQLQEHDAFGGGDVFLAEVGYPVSKSAAEFYLDYMTVHPANGYLVTGPSNSPENSFYPEGASEGSRSMSMGPTMDTMLVRELFTFCIDASRRLGKDEALREKLERALPLLAPPMIGRAGQLQEWLEDYEEAQPDHRHLSHLYGVYPGNEITPDGTPPLANAAKVTLDNRQRESTLEDVEFTLALFAAGRARLRDGDKAREHLAYLIGELCFPNLLTFSKPGIAGAETYIFIADGNFGGAAAFAEMLLQSHAGEIHLLPAIPSSWPEGSYSGLKARGGAEIGAEWKEGRLISATIKASDSLRTKLRYGETDVEIDMAPGEFRSFDGALNALK
ncbi:glycosyl hydrolase family 95 catalytic domain-containing protein [Cohnella soli]|uniref:Glycoside hydrolase N-terminal domain-containing protein n=1 Tax=Cohnella soli TaxID=425005 RepID=A0ABW0HP93_9BACL